MSKLRFAAGTVILGWQNPLNMVIPYFQQVVYLLNRQILEGSLMLTINVYFGGIPTEYV